MNFNNLDKMESLKEPIDKSEIDYLDNNTANNESDIIDNNINKYTKAELKSLYNDFAGYVNGKVIYENDGKNIDRDSSRQYGEKYKNSGLHHISWSKDSVENTQEIVALPIGTKIIQYSHDTQSGQYFAPIDTPYEELQLPDSVDKRVLNIYEVLQDFSVEKSEIAPQYFNQNSGHKQSVYQYYSELNADALVKLGIIKKHKI